MDIRIQCPKCKLIVSVKVKFGNLIVKCGFCGSIISVNGSIRLLPEEEVPSIDPRCIV